MINSVRNTVLGILNKNNYGYISPADFNQYALQAQLEIFEDYFANYNKQTLLENARQSGTDYADMAKPIAEVMEYFIAEEYLYPKIITSGTNTTPLVSFQLNDTNNNFSSVSFGDIVINITDGKYATVVSKSSNTSLTLSNNIFTLPATFYTIYSKTKFSVPSLNTTGSDFFMINKIVAYIKKVTSGTNTATVTSYKLVDSANNFTSVNVGDIVVNSTDYTYATVVAKDSNTTLSISNDIFTAVGKSYSIYDKTKISEAERVSNGKITSLNASLLTAPDTMFPVYTLVGETINAYPETLVGYGTLKATYFRYPYPPKWTYSQLSGSEPVFNPSATGYQDFELPQEDEYKLAAKILEYCGISIREIQVAQYAIAERQKQTM